MNERTRLLNSFAGCGWNTIPMSRGAIAEATVLARAQHGAGAVVESCQRLEVYHHGCDACPAPERWSGPAAVQHLAEVAAGLHSVVLGEAQILGQVRTGVATVSGPKQDLAGIAIASARELRERTNFNSHAGALLDKGLRLAELPKRRRLLVLGPGQMGRLVALRAVELGFDEVILAGRSLPDARTLGVIPWTLDRLAEVGEVDCIVGCLGSGADEIAVDELPTSVLVLDLGTPRNFRAGERPLLTLSELMADEESRPHAVRRRTALREELAEIVDRRLGDWQATSATAIGSMRRAAERVRKQEVERALRLHPEMDPAAADALARAIINQLLDAPTRRIREDPALASVVANLFDQPGAAQDSSASE